VWITHISEKQGIVSSGGKGACASQLVVFADVYKTVDKMWSMILAYNLPFLAAFFLFSE
jgi:hypothetical protein